MPRLARLLWPAGRRGRPRGRVGRRSDGLTRGTGFRTSRSAGRSWRAASSRGRGARRAGPACCLTLTGFAWFAGTFADSLVYLHRGPLVHCVLAYPTGRARSRVDRVAVAIGYAAALVPAPAEARSRRSCSPALFVAVAVCGYLRAVGKERRARLARSAGGGRARRRACRTGALARVAFPAGDANEAVLLAYELGLVIVAVGLLVAALACAVGAGAVGDLVVELGEAVVGHAAGRARTSARRPDVEVGYWLRRPRLRRRRGSAPVELPRAGLASCGNACRAGRAAACRARPRSGGAR